MVKQSLIYVLIGLYIYNIINVSIVLNEEIFFFGIQLIKSRLQWCIYIGFIIKEMNN